ncbi:MAG: hypothetical protein KTR31_33685 [Myxococcales bacterium]|nr:hypothetical protein [Myxococcales bacterium]
MIVSAALMAGCAASVRRDPPEQGGTCDETLITWSDPSGSAPPEEEESTSEEPRAEPRFLVDRVDAAIILEITLADREANCPEASLHFTLDNTIRAVEWCDDEGCTDIDPGRLFYFDRTGEEVAESLVVLGSGDPFAADVDVLPGEAELTWLCGQLSADGACSCAPWLSLLGGGA